ncbi:ankyrin repeat domain-containing protein [Bradyrhizobium roseum]|uniref:ankyrin repeat domain-containing protein n=1 Tax=Bradyrhizobium roseum TaxID=3056648 RepID=UPI0026159ABE|nr:ankyrin repeat domain-containing protein [Bradyrhizobium roseus]WKA28542.1 ankyrin repeat domain-containing protein [Bradyrhizobium roseus]
MLDARDVGAFEKSHLTDAQRVSSQNLSALLNATTRTRPILIYCYHGNASREYAQIFSDFGFSEVYSLDGGYEAWRAGPPADDRMAIDAELRQWLVTQHFAPADVNAVVANATTPLMMASHHGDGEIVRLLIAAGGRVNARNADGNNALWFACVGEHPDVIDMLVEAGIDIDNGNHDGATPLMYAASSGKAAIVARLLARGADASLETPDGFSALDLAQTVECLKLLHPRQRISAASEP